MRKALFISLFFSLLLSRENPFIPADIIKKFEKATNETESLPPFKSAKITLPSSARVLKEILVKYQNIDGSESVKKIKIDSLIDWHKPLIISQRSEKKSDLNLTSLNKKNKKSVKKIEKISSLKPLKNKKSNFKSKEFKINKFLRVKIEGKAIYLFTKNRKLRNFMVAKPYKIIIDFKSLEDISFKTIKTNLPFVKKIVIGNHIGYFRAVFVLDGNYGYKIRKISSGYLITLK